VPLTNGHAVPPDDLPPISYWRPGTMTDLVAGYFRYAAPPEPDRNRHEVLLPGWPKVYLLLPGTPSASMTIRRRTFDPLPTCGFVGTTSYASALDYGGGVVCGVSLLPKGWARLFGGDLSRHTNRVVPLETVDPYAQTMIDLAGGSRSPVDIFEPWLSARLTAAAPADPLIDRFMALLSRRPPISVAELQEELGLARQQLAALSSRAFGLTPKRVIVRHRFVAAVERVLADPHDAARAVWEAGYIDRSHFVKDCQKFLGCSLSTFRRRRGPLNDVALAVRQHEQVAPLV
jgi:AraC-like DNA-binding protein